MSSVIYKVYFKYSINVVLGLIYIGRKIKVDGVQNANLLMFSQNRFDTTQFI